MHNKTTPTYLSKNNKNSITIIDNILSNRFERILDNCNIKIMKLQIRDCYRHIYLNHNLSQLTKFLESNLPCLIWTNVREYHIRSIDNFYKRMILSNNKKINRIIKKRDTEELKNIKPIEYFYNSKHYQGIIYSSYTVKKSESNEFSENIHIIVQPDTFSNIETNPLNNLKPKWFINNSHTNIPIEISRLLQLGGCFSLPFPPNKNKLITEFIKDIESNIHNVDIISRQKIRQTVIPKLKNYYNEKTSNHSIIDNKLLQMHKLTQQFIKQHPNIIFTRADKGNITVAIDKNEYLSQMKNALNDPNTYTVVEKNPTKKIENELNNRLKHLLNKKYITSQQYHSLRSSDKLIPKVYGTPKTYKIGYPLRIIISSVNSPLYSVGNFIHNILKKSLPKARSFVENSFTLSGTLSNQKIDDPFILMSLDVVSMFTNVSTDLALKGIENR